MDYFLGIDIGGTHASCALVDAECGTIYNNRIYSAVIDAGGTADVILRSWRKLIEEVLAEPVTVAGIGFAMPGPFRYREGICMMEGVSKYDALFGINIREEIRKIFPDRTKPVAFINDALGFALGEFHAGAARGSRRTVVITLGTGLGSAFLLDGMAQEGSNGAPPQGYLYNVPYKESIGDDYFSSRRFIRRWEEIAGRKTDGVKALAGEASAGDPAALALFGEFAGNLAEFISPWLSDFQADTLVVGGNIAKASALFLPGLIEKLNPGIRVKRCELWEKAPVCGAAMHLKSLAGEAKLPEHRRKTSQFPAPGKALPTPPGQYDIYPAFPVGTGRIEEGVARMSQWIQEQKTVIIDGYEGVLWDDLTEQIAGELNGTGRQVRWFHTDAALLPPVEIEAMIRPFMGERDSVFGKITDKKLADWFDAGKLKKLQPDPDADINILVGCGAALAGWDAGLIYVDLPKNELQFRMRAGSVCHLGAGRTEDSRVAYKRMFFVDWVALNRHKAELLPRIGWIVDGQRLDRYLCMRGEDLRKGLSAMSRNVVRARPWFEPGAWGGTWLRDRIAGLNRAVRNLAWSFELMALENGIMFESDHYRLEVSFDFLMFNSYREVLGDCAERFRYDFPIRFDFLDTFDGGNLSVQCHPRPEYIREVFGMPFTQDETYYILDCKDNPAVYLGFQEGIDPGRFRQELVDSEKNASEIDVEKYVRKHPARKHDLFLIPSGTVHASGKNSLVLEISSAPYIFTFKMYDWLRLDLDGRPRPINIEHGMKNVCFERQGRKVSDELICKPRILERKAGYMLEHLPTHPEHFYDIHRYTFDREIRIETNRKCHVCMLVEGSSVIVETAAGMKQRFNYAETFIIPAAAGSYTVRNESDEKIMLVKAFVK
jgi:predicted NBD/HSP70 family sugar kinase/mannose-6-phosphate isomerase class I